MMLELQIPFANPMTAKGDLITALALGSPMRRGVGSDGCLLTADSAQSDGMKWAAAAAGLPTKYRQGLRARSNATTPNSKIDLQKGKIRSDDDTTDLAVAATLTADASVAGPAANGRDQAAVFTVSSWVFLHVIGGGGNPVATLLSASATAPTLPGTYTKSAMRCPVRVDGLGSIIHFTCDDEHVTYWQSPQVLSSFNSIVLTLVDMSAAVPPQSHQATLLFDAWGASPGGPCDAQVFVTGESVYIAKDSYVAASLRGQYYTGCCAWAVGYTLLVPCPTQDFQIKISNGPNGGWIDAMVLGYAFTRA